MQREGFSGLHLSLFKLGMSTFLGCSPSPDRSSEALARVLLRHFSLPFKCLSMWGSTTIPQGSSPGPAWGWSFGWSVETTESDHHSPSLWLCCTHASLFPPSCNCLRAFAQAVPSTWDALPFGSLPRASCSNVIPVSYLLINL